MKRILTASQMREIDRRTIEEHEIPGYQLMTRAGEGIADCIHTRFLNLDDAPVVILAGGGNNGGDGFVLARRLRQLGARPTVVLLGCGPEDLAGDAARAAADWAAAEGKTRSVPTAEAWSPVRRLLEDAELVVDAILGTGARGAPRGAALVALETLEELEVPVVAVDLPSGVEADTGRVSGHAVHADYTVALANPKRGHYLYPGRAFAGHLEWIDIGIPPELEEAAEGPRVYLVEPEDILERLPERDPEMHKGDRGRLLLVGGSLGLTGAVALAAGAAVRAGAGLVTAGVPRSLHDVVAVKLTEAMTLPLPELENTRALSREAFDSIALFQPGRLTALAVGPGMGRHPGSLALVRRIIEEIDLPLVLDADALRAFEGEPDALRSSAAGARLVLTPHAGEFSMLTGESPDEIAAHRIDVAARWAERMGVVLVLKGAPTVIGFPDGSAAVNPTGSEALATGGTGDVLTGLIGGFLAQGVEPADAAVLGVFLHGWTADVLVEDWGSFYGLAAGDLVDAFPLALGEFLAPAEDADDPLFELG